jgi:UDP-3-O-acyl N-acetylglucosamine deacetylase
LDFDGGFDTLSISLESLRKQNTISDETSVSGFGYWNNKDVTVTFRPAEAGSGITFVRTDLSPAVRIKADIEHRIESPRRTVLSHGGANVEMIEHIMSALYGLQIDNCEVHCDGSEMPGCDGSSLPFIEALQSAGVEAQAELRPRLVVTENSRINDDDDGWIEARPLGKKDPIGMHLQYRLDYGINHIIGRQTFRCTLDTELYTEQIAPARTYLLKDEADWMRQQGLGTRATYQDLLVFADPEGVIDNELRFEDECVRHKVLDMVGDLALSGFDLIGNFVAYRSGHRLNAQLAKALLSEGKIIDAPRAMA